MNTDSDILSCVRNFPCKNHTKKSHFTVAQSIEDSNRTAPSAQSSNGYLLSHTIFPSNYRYNINSKYTIYGLDIGQRLDIQFYYVFDVEAGNTNCSSDYLEINGAVNATRPERDIIKFCNTQGFRPKPNLYLSFTVIRPRVVFSFRTGSNGAGKGFFFKYRGESIIISANRKPTLGFIFGKNVTCVRHTCRHGSSSNMRIFQI